LKNIKENEMKYEMTLWERATIIGLVITLSTGLIGLGIGNTTVEANSTPQSLPFTQDWTNIGLITANDDWSMVPGIQAFQGNDLTTATGVDPRTILADGSATVLDVIANVANCDTNASGGIAECEMAGGNPTIALQGSGTADVPYIILYLNTTGQNNVRVAFNARDVDGSADNAIQAINTQYRVGNMGNFINVPGGFVADASTGPSMATLVTPVAVTLPAAASNQALVEVRITSTNAVGSDEWIGIDDINVTTAATPARSGAPVDFNGDGRTDWAVTRDAGQRTWFYNTNGTGAPSVALDWGLNLDRNVPEDYDGDGKDDIAVWRPAAGTGSAFYILRSSNNTVQISNFGIQTDNPRVVGDYDGDGKADVAVYRGGAQSTWFYRGTLNNPSGNITFVPWGTTGDRVAPGDYDGDGKYDFVIARNDGGSLRFWMNQSNAGFATQVFGLQGDIINPGDYDGDSKTDLAVVRIEGAGGIFNWYIQPSSGGAIQQFLFGSVMFDTAAQGDYDGDGKTDIAIWRSLDGTFWARNSSNGAAQAFQLGASGDSAVANYNSH
jgi:FG-GAP-like repeat